MVGAGPPTIGWIPVSADPQVASARIRSFEPVRYLQQHGFPVEIFSAANQDRYRVVVFQKCYEERHLALAGNLREAGKKTVFDLCDNHFYNPTNDAATQQRIERLNRMIGRVDVVTVSTPELAKCLPREAVVVRDGISPPQRPTLLQRIRTAVTKPRQNGSIELAWYGTPNAVHGSTGIPDLLRIAPMLEELAAKYPLRLTVISSSLKTYDELIRPLKLKTHYVQWRSYSAFCSVFPFFDLCLIPITPTPFTLCKSNNRIALSLYLGVPVVADSIPSYREFDQFCVLDDWYTGLRKYFDDPQTRRRHAENGRKYVMSHHMTEHSANEWRTVLESLL